MTKIFKKFKTIFAFILGLIVSTAIVYADNYLINSDDVKYNNNDSNLAATNVQNAIDELNEICESSGKSYEFTYSGSVTPWTVPYTGTYRLEVWGAQGGDSTYGGKGGYSRGLVNLTAGSTIYIVVGGQGTAKNGASSGGYNGGGSSSTNSGDTRLRGSGGGATHIASVTGTLSSIGAGNLSQIYIVAGGGGGRGENSAAAGAGGGISGTAATATAAGAAGTQTSGYAFGQGGTSTSILGAGGGGGGLYGGTSTTHYYGGCGGSGYIGGVTNGVTASNSRTGNGYALITYLGN